MPKICYISALLKEKSLCIAFGIMVKTKCTVFNTCIVYSHSRLLNEVTCMRQFSKLSERLSLMSNLKLEILVMNYYVKFELPSTSSVEVIHFVFELFFESFLIYLVTNK